MEKLLKEFNIPAKHRTEQELRLWRNSVMPVKNCRRRFRYVANLDKRLEAKDIMAKIRDKLQASHFCYMQALKNSDAGDELGPDKPFGRAGEAQETEFKNEAPTAGSGTHPCRLAVVKI